MRLRANLFLEQLLLESIAAKQTHTPADLELKRADACVACFLPSGRLDELPHPEKQRRSLEFHLAQLRCGLLAQRSLCGIAIMPEQLRLLLAQRRSQARNLF